MPTTPKKASSRVLDLNAARAARAEQKREPVVVKIGKETFTLPAEMPYDAVRHSVKGEMDETILALFEGDKKAEARFYAQKLTNDDVEALITGLLEIYGAADAGK